MSWSKVKIGSFLKRRKDSTEVQNSILYKRITIKTKHQGIYLRDELKGSLIGTKLQFIVNKGQFLLSKIDARLGAFGIVPEDLDQAIITGNFWAFDVDREQVNIEWFNLFTSSGNFYEICNRASSGTTHRKYLDEAKFLNFEIDLPDIDDQNDFIQSFNGYKKKHTELENELEKQQTYLQQLRQSILQEAVQGKLSESGLRKLKNEQNDSANSVHSVNPDFDKEDAATLLERIRAEKQQLIAAGKLKKEKPLPPITADEIPFELPEGWVWCRLGEIVLKSEAGKSLVCDKRPAEDNEWGIIKVSAMSWGEFDEKENKVLPKGVKPSVEFQIRMGDYLISRANTEELIGKSVIVKEINSNLLLSDKSIRIIFSTLIDKRYINLYNNSSIAREYYKIVATGTSDSMKNISREQMYMLPIALPSISEQQRIVDKVQQLMQVVNHLEQQAQQSQTQAQKLLQAVLKEAFSPTVKLYAENEMITMAAEE